MPTDRRAALIALSAGIVTGYVLTRRQSVNLPSPPGFFLEINKRRLHYTESGAGPALVFLHDSPGSVFDWQRVTAILARNHTCVGIDRPGMGYSDPLPTTTRQGLPAFAGTLDTILAQLKIVRPVLVGHGYGGGAALTFAAQHPDALAGLVLIGSVGYKTGDPSPAAPPPFGLPFVTDFVKQAIGILTYGETQNAVTSAIRAAFAPEEAQLDPADLTRNVALFSRSDSLASAAQIAYNLWADEKVLRTQLPAISVPTLIIHGAEDTVIPDSAAEKLYAALPDVRLELLTNAGHALPYTRPADLARLIAEFRAEH